MYFEIAFEINELKFLIREKSNPELKIVEPARMLVYDCFTNNCNFATIPVDETTRHERLNDPERLKKVAKWNRILALNREKLERVLENRPRRSAALGHQGPYLMNMKKTKIQPEIDKVRNQFSNHTTVLY